MLPEGPSRGALLCVDCWAIFFYFFAIAGGAI